MTGAARALGRIKKHRAALCALGTGLAALGAFWTLRGCRPCMDWWVQCVSMPFKAAVSAAVDPLPFSFCELGATLLGLFVLAMLARCLRRAMHRRKSGFGTFLLHTAAVAVWIYALVCAFWGTQYYAASFAERAGMACGPVAAQELAAVTRYFARQANACAEAPARDADGVFAVGTEEIFAASAGVYEGAAEEYPFLAGPVRRPKPAFYSKLMSAWGFTGYLCPLFGESTLNVDAPAVFLPVTVAHEFAHQRGVAAEQEANFCGIEACVASGNGAYAYSGWLFGYLHLSNALYTADREAWRRISEGLSPPVRADLEANNAYWAHWEGPVKEVGGTVYTAFLQGYGQELGMKSYGACVDLLVEKYAEIAALAG